MRGGPVFEFLFGIASHLRAQAPRERFKLVFFTPGEQPGQRLGPKAAEGIRRELAKRGLPHLVHAELDHAHSEPMAIASSYQSFLKTRPAAWENDAIAMVIRVMKQLVSEGLQPHAHIVHLSSAEALPLIRNARADGLNLTVETCPHYLVLEAETIPDGQATFKCCPPIREKANQLLLWQALLDGTIDCVVSDHSPCTPQLKNLDSGDLEKAWGGISGLQFGLPLLWTHAQQNGMSLTQLSELMSARPAQLTGLNDKGVIAVTGSRIATSPKPALGAVVARTPIKGQIVVSVVESLAP